MVHFLVVVTSHLHCILTHSIRCHSVKLKKQSSFKDAIKRNGIERVLNNPLRYLKYKKSEYSPEYIRQLKHQLKARYLK